MQSCGRQRAGVHQRKSRTVKVEPRGVARHVALSIATRALRTSLYAAAAFRATLPPHDSGAVRLRDHTSTCDDDVGVKYVLILLRSKGGLGLVIRIACGNPGTK